MLKLFLITFLLYLLLQALTFALGSVFLRRILKIRFDNFFLRVFAECVCGVTLLVTGYAVFHNGYQTIFVAAVPLFAYLIFYCQTHPFEQIAQFETSEITKTSLLSKPNAVQNTLILWLSSAVIFSISFFVKTDAQSPFLFSKFDPDYTFYAKIAKYLTINHQENSFHVFNTLLPERFDGMTFYHYFDMWLTNFVSQFSPFSAFLNQELVVYSYLLFLIFLGIKNIVSAALKNDWANAGAALAAMYLFGGAFLPLTEYLPKSIEHPSVLMTFQMFEKTYIVSVLLLLCANLYLRKLHFFAFFFLAIIPILYTVTAPAITVGMFAWMLLALYRKRFAEMQFAAVITLLFISGVVIVAMLNPSPPATLGTSLYSVSFIIKNFQLNDLRTMLNAFVVTQYLTFLVYLIPLLIAAAFRKTILQSAELIDMFFIGIAVFYGGLGGYVVFFKDINAVQLFKNIGLPFTNVLVLLLFVFIYKQSQNLSAKRIIAFCFCLIAIVNTIRFAGQVSPNPTFDSDYYSSIKQLIEENKIGNRLGVSLLGQKDYASVFWVTSFYEPNDTIFAYNDDYLTFGLSDYEKKNVDDTLLTAVRTETGVKSGFYKNYLEAKITAADYPYKNLPLNAFEHQRQYLADNKVEYAIVTANYPYWEKLEPLSEFYFENKLNQEKFVVFKK